MSHLDLLFASAIEESMAAAIYFLIFHLAVSPSIIVSLTAHVHLCVSLRVHFEPSYL